MAKRTTQATRINGNFSILCRSLFPISRSRIQASNEYPRRTLEILEDRLYPATLLHSLFPDPTGPQEGAAFGYSVAADTNFRVVGAWTSDAGGVADVGQAFVFDAATGALVATLSNPTPAANDLFGISVGVSGSVVVVGARLDDTGATDSGAAYIFNASTGALIATLNNPTPAVNDYFGDSVAVSGNTVIVGAVEDDSLATNAGSAYLFNSTTGALTTTLNNPSPAAGDFFGTRVAVSGNVVVVGADGDDTGAANAGIAYLFNATTGALMATLNNPTPAAGDMFGFSVAVSGNTAVVAARYDDTGATDAGSAYLFNATTGALVATLNNPTPATSDFFGVSVAVSGNTVVVGSPQDDSGTTDSGGAYIFNATTGGLAATLNNPSPAAGDGFGVSVAASGNAVVVGAWLDDAGATDAGAAYVFNATSGVLTATLSNATTPNTDHFGASIAMSGNTLVVGIDKDDTSVPNAGSAQLFSTVTGALIATLNNPTPANFDEFGWAVAISGNTVVVGAYLDDTTATDSGAAYIFNATTGALVATLNNPTPVAGDGFGVSVAVSGNTVVVGAFLDDAGATDSGSAYVFNATTGALIATLNNPTPAATDHFGISVAIAGNAAVVGADQDDTGATNAGSVYMFDATSGVLITTVNNPGPAASDNFGYSIAISGNTVVVGAYHDDAGATDSGSAYMFNATTGALIATLNNPTPEAGDLFGRDVGVSGNIVVVSAYSDNTGAADAGSAYLFDVQTGAFVDMLNNPTPAVADSFGFSVAVAGNTITIGADSDDTQNRDQGAAYVFSIPASNLTVTSVQFLDGNFNIIPSIQTGTMVRLRVDVQTRDIPAGTNYSLVFSVGGIAEQFTINWGAGLPGVGNYWGWADGWYASGLSTDVTVTVDALNAVAEYNESDNSQTFNFTAIAPTPPTKFIWPLGGMLGVDYEIGPYCDVDPRPGISVDYRGGSYQYDGHTAIDIGVKNFGAMDAGTPVYAAAAGTVIAASDGAFDRVVAPTGTEPANYVRIDHGGGWWTTYFHAKRDSVLVSVGQIVAAGQQIMSIGSSGQSTGPHVHFETSFRGLPVETMYAPSDYYFAAPPYAGITPGLLDAGVTNSLPTSIEMKESISWMTTYNQTSGQGVFFLTRITGFSAGDVARWIFKRPNGAEFANYTYTMTGQVTPGYWYASVTLPFTPDLGTWTTVFQRNGITMHTGSFTVSAAGGPEIKLYQDSTYVIDGRTTPLDFGNAERYGAGVVKSFTLSNHGTAPLTVGSFILPTGYSLASAPATTVAPGASTTFAIRLDASFLGYTRGVVRFTTNDANEADFDFQVEGTVVDTITPKIQNVYFSGTSWSTSFRTAAGNATYGYAAQSAAGQFTSMPWSNVNTIYFKFSENVSVESGDLGIRGINVASYAISGFTYDSVNFVAKWVLTGPIDTDRILLDLDGDGASAVADLAGNKLAGSWTEGVSTFPTSGAAAQDFKYRFVVAVGDADRNGLVRNADVNLVRANLFVDAGTAGYDIYRDIDGNGQTRNADINLVRGHLFVDPPAGPGPNRPGRAGASPGHTWADDLRSTLSTQAATWGSRDQQPMEKRRAIHRRVITTRAAITFIDAIFETD